ncbi:glycosyltransferase family 39 protein [Aquisphaera insulae]|uniref:glycosyltransferase family 39 protein n=1 Tax=Aquisphaera insulae TaxID=2712864 RepID=UPI0013ECADE7|nr:glycosyltransferase family 39 protein [Aquisphaera insulae]
MNAPKEKELAESHASSPGRIRLRGPLGEALAVAALLVAHVALAESSLVRENATVDEVVHLPAGITYWQQHTFRLYHHNPPLVRMVAALPAVLARPVMEPVYQQQSWSNPDPSPTTFSQSFARFNSDRYFDLFTLARMVMPVFGVIGGLVVFAWSRSLYGTGGGLLSLALWCFCPNILAHGRLLTTDAGSTAVGVLATFAFWLYLRKPGWRRAVLAGVLLGLAQLCKFSMLVLYLVWPFLAVVWLALVVRADERTRTIGRYAAHGFLVVLLSLLTIDAGYFFEGVGTPLGRFEFASSSLTRPVPGGLRQPPATKNQLFAMMWPFRENRFRGTFLAGLPSPLPSHYLLGFDEQRVETEGIPVRLSRAFEALGRGDLDAARAEALSSDRSVNGYPVYLNGELRRTGWWYYYLATLAYKLPEGTWLLILGSFALLAIVSRDRASWADEICLAAVPAVVLFSMSFLTDINLGLRYVLAILPYLYIAAGKVVPWAWGLDGRRGHWARRGILGSLLLTIAATATIHPSYLAYFNVLSGGPDRVPPRLIDSNLDWGQDLINLQDWYRDKAAGQPIGLAYFGQINPALLESRGPVMKWFIPPVRPGGLKTMGDPGAPPLRATGPAAQLRPGYYALSATIVQGLSWRIYDPSPFVWEPAWNAAQDAFSYFRMFTPIERIGHSIYVYKLTDEDVARADEEIARPITSNAR